jgi:SAM-dependent methyltransferase
MIRFRDFKIYFQMLFNYKPKKFWNELLTNSFDLRGVGHYRLSNEDNIKMYDEKKRVVLKIINENNIKITDSTNILEIGCGVGYWTEFLKSLGAIKYTGNDIAEVSVNNLRQKYPEYKFIHGDISEIQLPQNEYDLGVVIDVTQHITDDDRFNTALRNIWSSLKQNAFLIITLWDPSKNVYLSNKLRLNRIEKPRGINWYKKIISDEGKILTKADFSDKYLLLIKKEII